VGRGDLLLINFDQTHSYEPQGEFIFCNILIQPGFLDQELIHSINAMDLLGLSVFLDFSSDMQGILPFTHFSGEERNRIEHLVNQMVQEFDQRKSGYLSMLRSMLTQLLILLFRQMRNSTPYSDLLEQVGSLSPQILQYIEENCSEKISLTELAKRCCYNPAYFSRMFKKCFGTNFTDFVQEKRIEKAKYLLMQSRKSISEIAQEVGYQDRKQFYAAFAKYNQGMTPGEYRKS
jgi:YesN/AraC family two-component response regulator